MRELLVKSTISIIEKKRKSGGKFQYSQKREKLRIVKDFQKNTFVYLSISTEEIEI
jgi:hypothetical protein